MGEKRRPVENEGGGASREAGSEGAAQGGGDPGRGRSRPSSAPNPGQVSPACRPLF